METSKNFFTSPKRAMYFVVGEVFILLLIMLQLYFIFRFEYHGGTLQFVAQNIPFQNWVWVIASLGLYVILYATISTRDAYVKKIHKELVGVILSETKGKIVGMNRTIIGLYFAEIVIVLLIAVSIFLYLDPEINVVPAPYNYGAFAVLVIMALMVFSRTKPFTEIVYGDSLLTARLHGHLKHDIVRTTNPTTGSIRIGSKFRHRLVKHTQDAADERAAQKKLDLRVPRRHRYKKSKK